MHRCFLELVWVWLCLFPISEGSDLPNVDMVCVFPEQEQPTDHPQKIVRYLTHHPHVKLNIFYWHLSDLGFHAASLSLPSHVALELGHEFGAECEPVRMMSVASSPSSRYTQAIREKYQSRRKTLEKTIQCTISYDTYDQLLQHVDTSTNSRNTISVYVLDTGIQANHSQFEQLPPEFGFDALSSPPLRSDPNGHGTQVAGLIAGKSFGVAPLSQLIDVRVANAEGFARVDHVIAGLDFIAGKSNQAGESSVSFSLNSVVCLSLTADFNSSAVNSALQTLSSVVMIIAAAGDHNKYTCGVSPASSRTVIVAAATSRGTDMEILGSNFGECIHIYAPGENLLTTTTGSLDSTVRISGSSASAALVTSIWSAILRFYSEPENLRLDLGDIEGGEGLGGVEGDDEGGNLKDFVLTEADRVLLLKDNLLHPVSGRISSSEHEDSWVSCEFSSPESALRHMNQRYRDWVLTRRSMKKFMDPQRRRQFLSSRPPP